MSQDNVKRNKLGDVVKNVKITGSFSTKKNNYVTIHKAEVILKGEWLVTEACWDGGTTGNDSYPDGWHITLTKLNTRGQVPSDKILATMSELQHQDRFGGTVGWLFEPQKPGMTVSFYQNSHCYTGEGYFEPVRKMKQVWVDAK